MTMDGPLPTHRYNCPTTIPLIKISSKIGITIPLERSIRITLPSFNVAFALLNHSDDVTRDEWVKITLSIIAKATTPITQSTYEITVFLLSESS